MSRSTPEWIGKTDDSPAPPRVRMRTLVRFGHHCAICGRAIRPGDKWTCDHIKALINGGTNSEYNLQPLCSWCVKYKDAADVAEKAKVYAVKSKHYGVKRSSRPLPFGRNSKLKRKITGEVVERKGGNYAD